MIPALAVLSAWLLFGGSHLLLSSSPLRGMLVARLGVTGFVACYCLIATLGLGLLIVVTARFGADGIAGPNLARIPLARWSLGAVAALGAVLAVAGIAGFSRSPIAVLARRWRAREVVGPLPRRTLVDRVTRHPFFVGLALLMGAHALLASTLSGAVYFAGFALLAAVGIPLQDRKLLERHGETYAAYLRESSVLPSVHPRGVGAPAPWPELLVAIAGAAALAGLHPLWRWGNGAAFAAVVLVGGLVAVGRQLRAASVR